MPLGFSILFFSLVSSLSGAVRTCVYVCVSQGSKPLLVSTTSSALEFLSSVRLFLSRNGAFRELSLVVGRNLRETASASVIGNKNCGGAGGGEAGLGLAEIQDEEAICMANPVKAAVQTRAEASASSEDDESDIDFRVRDPIHQCPSLCQILEELKELMGIACPIAAMNCVVYVRAMVSVLCLGRLGGLELAGGALSIGFTNITGYSVLFGLATGMDPVCSQAFGSKNWEVIGHTLQRTILILLTACIPISLLWINLQEILLQLGQDSEIIKVATIYCLYSLPDLLTNSLLQPLRVYLRSQGITTPMMCCSALAVLLHIPLNIILVFVFKLGVPGVAMAAVCTNLNMVFLLLGYLWFSGVYKRTWVRWSMACFQEWWPLLSLAVPSCLAICLEWWWYELMTFLAGLLPNPQVAVATAAILIQTTSLLYTFPLALSSSVSTRVGNELGANRPAQARIATFVALGCALVIAFLSLVWSTAFRNKWGHLFTEDKSVLALTAAAMPLMGLCELGNCPQTTGCGVLRGSARPAIAARINLGSFYFVGMTVAVVLAFWFKIGFGGLWYGLLAAQIACACSTSFVVLRTDWGSEAERAKKLTGPNNDDIELCKGSSNKVVPILNDDRGDECLLPKQFSGLDCKVELCQSDIEAMTIVDDDDDDDDEADPLLTQTRTANVHRKKVVVDVHNSPPLPFTDRHKN